MKKRLVIINIFLVLSFILTLSISIINYRTQEDTNYYNKARVLLSSDILAIEDGKYEAIKYPFYIIDSSAKIIWFNNQEYKKGEELNMDEELQDDYAFSKREKGKVKLVFPIKNQEGLVDSFAICILNKDLVQGDKPFARIFKVFYPLIMWAVIFIIFAIYYSYYMIKKVMKPAKEISKASEAIIKGDYDREIIQRKNIKDIKESDIEKLVYDFELMRDELKERRNRENQLKKSQKELMSCMSHDLRTPITTIKAHAEAIRDGLATTEEKREKYIDTIINKTDVLNSMIKGLLEHSNAELNQLSITFNEVYIKSYIDKLAKELNIFCKGSTFSKCDFVCDNELPEIILTMDEGRITEVIFNLVENAVKYMDKPQGKINMKCWMNKEQKRVYISIKDNGPGISMVDIPYVFNRFYRAEKSRSMQIPGAGLGLSICKYIINAHSGDISLKSKNNEGSIFTFYIPIDLFLSNV